MIMLLAKPITTITAWITMEAGAVLAFLFSMFAQVTPNPLGFSRDGSMILAYASFVTAIAGGIVAIIQVVTTARNSKVASELMIVRLEAAHKEEMAQLRDKERQREIEILKLQSEAQNKEILRNNAWIQDVKRKHPAEEFGPDPSQEPEPKIVEALATPIYPINYSPATPAIPGTESAPYSGEKLPEAIERNTEAVKENTGAVLEAASKLTGQS